MEKERKYKLMWRWSLITAGTITLFWTIWYLVAGQVPVVTSIKMTPELTWQLPFGISRWWDILIGPIWLIMLILIFTSRERKKYICFIVGAACGLIYGLFFSPAVGLVAGLIVAMGLLVLLWILVLVLLLMEVVKLLLSESLAYLFSPNLWKSIGNWLLVK